jgi:GNAT superfamily N-acetyltransferase
MIVVGHAIAEELADAKWLAESSFAELRRIYVPRKAASDNTACSRVVARIDGQIAGTVLYEIQPRQIHLRELAVDAQHRRQGVARAIIEYLASIALAAACPRMTLYTIAQTGNVAIFERLGFRTVSEEPAIWAASPGREELVDVLMERPTV